MQIYVEISYLDHVEHNYRHASGIGIIYIHRESLSGPPCTPYAGMIFIPRFKKLSYCILQLINPSERNFA